MQRSSFREMNCSIGQSLEVVGEWWSLLIIRDAIMGVTRFDEFQARLGIARNVLNQRLSHLVDEGVLERVAYNEHPPRYDYVLTEQGRDLWPVVVALRQWGDRWRAPDGPPLQLVHRQCGHIAELIPVCGHCGDPVGPADVSVVAEPGYASTTSTANSGQLAATSWTAVSRSDDRVPSTSTEDSPKSSRSKRSGANRNGELGIGLASWQAHVVGWSGLPRPDPRAIRSSPRRTYEDRWTGCAA
jgi:DNA-binding HxlR family transcriptional regulator